MKIIGLTGQSGAGKGTVAGIFAKYGIPSIDTDAVYHEILDSGGDCTAELVSAFGESILDGNCKINRKKLSSRIFGKQDTPELLHILNRITHKYIMTETKKRLAHYQTAGAPAALVDAPLLFEAKMNEWCDLVIGVLASRDLRVSRIIARDGISRENALRRIAAQQDDAFFRENCDIVLENNGGTEELEQKILAVLATLKGE